MKYKAIAIQPENASPEQTDILIAWLSALPVEGFEEQPGRIIVYMNEKKYDRKRIESVIASSGHNLKASIVSEETVPEKNWNREWERNFQPVVIQNQCLIRAPFHRVTARYRYEIIIEPKMSFGTGHHETTQLMIEEMLGQDFRKKSILDAGCGTGILSVLAIRMGAESVTALDNDEWAFRNCQENIRRNHAEKIEVRFGTASIISGQRFDRILANINLNILLSEAEQFARLLNKDALVMMSGIYQEDCKILERKAMECGLQKINSRPKNKWAVMTFQKI
jgi:ribosomal protein L11 methyltransferase